MYVPTEESFPIPLKYIDVTRTADTTLEVMSEKHIEDYWNLDGERRMSGAWTGFTRFILLNIRGRRWNVKIFPGISARQHLTDWK